MEEGEPVSRAVRRDGRYSGLREDGREWPEVLVGAREVGGYLRMHPVTVRKMFREFQLPGRKDARGRWTTTRRLIDRWILESVALRRER